MNDKFCNDDRSNFDGSLTVNTDSDSLYDFHCELIRRSSCSDPKVLSLVRDIINYYESIISCMPGNVYWLGKKCQGVGCNQNVLKMFHLDKVEQFRGMDFETMASKDVGNWSKNQGNSFRNDTMDVINKGVPVYNRREPTIPGKDSNDVNFLTTRVPVFNKNGNVIGVVGISTDITSLVSMEKELLTAKEQATRESKEKTQFIMNLSHDVRTPFAGFIGLLGLLEEKTLDHEQRHLVKSLSVLAKSLLGLFNDLTSSINLDSGKLPIKERNFSIVSVINNIKALVMADSSSKNASFKTKYIGYVDQQICSDLLRIKRILLNLISNALKVAPPSQVIVSARILRREGDECILCLSVADGGSGISASKYKDIFRRLQKIEPSYREKNSGSGLGLYIVKQFLKDLGGTISLRSKIGKGSLFRCLIPCKLASVKINKDSRKQSANNLSSKSFSLKVLIVDDCTAILTVLHHMLQREGCVVSKAKCGVDALVRIKENEYDLIILDLGLPDIGGEVILGEIRKRSQTPIIILTGHGGAENQSKEILSLAMGVVEKPLKAKTLRKFLLKIEKDLSNKS